MSIAVSSIDPTPDIAELLAAAARHAEGGRPAEAMAAARSAVHAAGQAGDAAAGAETALCVAGLELRLFGRFAAALEQAQHAASLFQSAADPAGEARALCTQAIAALRLGYNEMAVDSALLAVKLSAAPQATPVQVMAYNALGIAMHFGRCFVEASNAYQQAVSLAQQCRPPMNAFELYCDLACTEALRYVTERNAGGKRLSLDILEIQIDRCHDLLARDAADAAAKQGAPASHANTLAVLTMVHSHLLIWRRRLDEADAKVLQLKQQVQQLDRPWLMALVHWSHTELALVRSGPDAAAPWARQMVEVAREHGHDGLLSVGCQLLCHVCEQRGDIAGALDALRMLAQREQLARAQSLKGRVAVVERQVEMRRQHQQLQRLQSDTRLYQRLALEDGLTGLPNRRQFEASLGAALQVQDGTAAPLCLAMIDVDKFKQINDTHSHNTGDEVLRCIAGLLRTHTREPDLPARLAGDEFVILLRDSDLDQAHRICARLQEAVRCFDWAAVAAGLQVSISVGLAAAQPGDTPQSLALRSDAQMYAHKRR